MYLPTLLPKAVPTSVLLPVHTTPHPRVAFLGMNLVHTGVVTNDAVRPLERERKLIGVEPHRVEPQRARSDRSVSLLPGQAVAAAL